MSQNIPQRFVFPEQRFGFPLEKKVGSMPINTNKMKLSIEHISFQTLRLLAVLCNYQYLDLKKADRLDCLFFVPEHGLHIPTDLGCISL